MTVPDRIMKRVSAHGKGEWVCTPKDFLDLGSRTAVDQALYRLVKAGKLRRIGHGMYDNPRMSKSLKQLMPAELDAVTAALERRDGVRIVQDGLVDANNLRLSNAVPVKPIYITDGHTRTLKINGRTIWLRHAGPSVMGCTGKPAAPVVRALRSFGPHIVAGNSTKFRKTLQRLLPDDVKRDMLKNIQDFPGWAMSLVLSITADINPVVSA